MSMWKVLVQEVDDSVIAVVVASSGLEKKKLEFQVVLNLGKQLSHFSLPGPTSCSNPAVIN